MADGEKSGLEFIQALELRHESVLDQLDELNRRVEQALEYYAESRGSKPLAGERPAAGNSDPADGRPAEVSSVDASIGRPQVDEALAGEASEPMPAGDAADERVAEKDVAEQPSSWTSAFDRSPG